MNSFSKYFSMTGWRLGWLLAPRDLIDPIDRLATNLALCPPTLAQHAAVHAFDDYAELDANVDRYRANRTMLLDGLRGLGLTRLAPADGAFYAYVDVSEHCQDSMEFCYRMLAETGVAVAPGTGFRYRTGPPFHPLVVRRRRSGDRRRPRRVAGLAAASVRVTRRRSTGQQTAERGQPGR